MATPIIGENDSFNLNRFIEAQAQHFTRALAEIAAGEKRTHWMWFIFPQIDGLASSSTSKLYAIKSIEEAKEYLAHPVLGSRLLNCATTVAGLDGRSALEIFGSPDDAKMRSCATLFATISPTGSVFQQILDKFYLGKPDEKTLRQLGNSARSAPGER